MYDGRKVAERLKDYRVIIDSNAINVSLPNGVSLLKHLHNGDFHALHKLNLDSTALILADLRQAHALIKSTNPYILTEVANEVGLLSTGLFERYNSYRQRFNGNLKVNGNGYASNLQNLDKIANRVDLLWKEIVEPSERVPWGDHWPNRIFNLAKSRSRDITARSIKAHGNANYIGIRLETDRKLATLLYLLGTNQKTALVTGDRGLITLANRMRRHFGNEANIPESCFPLSELRTYDLNDGTFTVIDSRQT